MSAPADFAARFHRPRRASGFASARTDFTVSRFRRQHPFGPYILDFYCAAARLAVEVDGRIHDYPDRIAHDQKRSRWLASQGIRVIRIAAEDVKNELDGVLAFIARVARERLADPSVTSRSRYAPPPHCVER